jgi:hypothetical protein
MRLNATAWTASGSASSHSISAGIFCSPMNTSLRIGRAAASSSRQLPTRTSTIGSPASKLSNSARSGGGTGSACFTLGSANT